MHAYLPVLGYFSLLVMGMVLGIFGAGGSILTLPILVYLFGVNPIMATLYSLAVVGITGALGAFQYHRAKLVDWPIALLLATTGVIGVYVSRTVLIPAIPIQIELTKGIQFSKTSLLMTLFSLVMLAAAFGMMRSSPEPAAHAPVSDKRHLRTLVERMALGLLVGLLSGLVGAGGGFLIIPILVIREGLSTQRAVGTSLLIITMNALLGIGGEIFRMGNAEIGFLATISLIALVGMFIGAKTARHIPATRLKVAFGMFVLFMGILVLLQTLTFPPL